MSSCICIVSVLDLFKGDSNTHSGDVVVVWSRRRTTEWQIPFVAVAMPPGVPLPWTRTTSSTSFKVVSEPSAEELWHGGGARGWSQEVEPGHGGGALFTLLTDDSCHYSLLTSHTQPLPPSMLHQNRYQCQRL